MVLDWLLPVVLIRGFFLGLAGAADGGRAHLGKDLVQPLQGSVEVELYPAGGARDRLPPTKQSHGRERDRERDLY